LAKSFDFFIFAVCLLSHFCEFVVPPSSGVTMLSPGAMFIVFFCLLSAFFARPTQLLGCLQAVHRGALKFDHQSFFLGLFLLDAGSLFFAYPRRGGYVLRYCWFFRDMHVSDQIVFSRVSKRAYSCWPVIRRRFLHRMHFHAPWSGLPPIFFLGDFFLVIALRGSSRFPLPGPPPAILAVFSFLLLKAFFLTGSICFFAVPPLYILGFAFGGVVGSFLEAMFVCDLSKVNGWFLFSIVYTPYSLSLYVLPPLSAGFLLPGLPLLHHHIHSAAQEI